MLTFKGIAKLFEDIEQRLISSLKRNLSRHKTEEKKEGFKWSAWQAEKLRNIDRFRRENRKIVKDYADVIDRDTRQLMQEQFREGEKLAEREVEEVTGSPITPVSDEHFFGINNEKMDKLITDITELEKNAESAALRMTDDVYRQTLHRAQLEMGTGSMTINQAVDMATREFLDKGINCIIYKDGKRVNIADYVRMALRTTSTRAQLQGKAKRFAELGYDTVLISQYGMCSKTCLPWQGKVYIDDVFTVWDGERRDGMGKSKYCGKWFPLLSVAMEAGLFHPNCRHTMSLWVEGVSKLPEPLNEAEIKEKSAAEQKQRELERKIRKHKRQVIGSTDEANVREAKKKLREAQKKLKELIDEHEELRRDYEREKVYDTAPSQPQETPQKPSEHPQSEIIPQENETPQSANMNVSEEAAKTAADIPETAPESQQGNVDETVDKSAESGIIKAENITPEIPQEIVDDVNKAVDKVKEDFPIISEQVEPIEFADTGDALGESGLRGNKAINVIKLSDRYCSDFSKLITKLLEDFESGFSYDTDNVGSLVCHELGHAIHKILALKRAGINYGEQLTPIKKAILERELYRITLEIYEAAFDNETLIEIEGACNRELGRITYKRPGELIAQSFGNYYYGKNKSRIAMAIVDYFKKELM